MQFKISFNSNLISPIDESFLADQSKINPQQLATILLRFKTTNILVEGHTDNTGKEAYNLDLSLARASSIRDFLTTLKVAPKRFTLVAFGDKKPIAINDTETGRQQTRRVTIALYKKAKSS
jgi:outer membrane protein OmpA-like peptidoglycan-associated protein